MQRSAAPALRARSAWRETSGRPFRTLLLVPLCAALSLGGAGCALMEMARQQERLGRIVQVRGHVEAQTESDAPLVVVLFALQGEDADDPESWALVDYIVRDRPGAFSFAVARGTYRVGAYQDLNANLKYDSGEPVVRPLYQPSYVLDWGERLDDVDLVIEAGSGIDLPTALDIAEEADAAAAREDAVSLRSLVARGEVAGLDDPRFAPENGTKGLWRPADFLVDVRPGLYFLQEYEEDRVPVLFVHGIGGNPRDFEFLIGGLDRSRFQPWVYLYPSGVALEGLGASLSSLVTDLQLRYGFERMAVVAHSMGGLVSRSFLLKLDEVHARSLVPVFITISTPFGGSSAAQIGADQAGNLPSAVSIPASFLDMAPKSAFLRDLFYVSEEFGILRPLPAGTTHHLIFGFRRRNLRTGPSSDGTIDLSSQLRVEAQAQAATRYGVDADHAGILREPVTSQRINALLAEAFR